MKTVSVPGRWEHAFVLATTMREKDVRELEAAGQTPLEGLLYAMSKGRCWAVLYDDVVGAMYGVRDIPTDRGPRAEVWMLSGHLFGEKPIAFVKAAHLAVKALLKDYQELVNCIDSRYEEALRLVKRLGATLGPVMLIGPQQSPFTTFSIRRH